MNKILRYSFVALLAMVFMPSFAGKIVFANLNLENGVQYSEPFDGGDFTVTFAGGANDGKYYTTGSGIRVYGGGEMTIKAKSGTLTKILITYDGTNKPTTADVVDGGTYDVATGLWTGDAESVVFTRPSGSGHWRVQSIATGDDAQVLTPTEGQTAATAITVTRALEIINALADGATSDDAYYVKGYVTSIKTITSSGASFFVGETADATSTVQTYNLKGFGNQTITNTGFVKEGDQVIVYGKLQKYKNNSTSEITPEVTSGYVYSVNGNTEDTTPNPEDAIQNGKTADDAMTVDQALNYIKSFSDSFLSSKQYYVKGTVSEVTEISTSNGNATFKLGDLVAFRLKGLENKNITDENYLKANDEVIIYAKLQKYVKNETVTPELSSGYIYSLNGKTSESEGYVPTGDGSKANPYTVEDLKHMAEAEYPTEKQWVKGVIIGSANSSTKLEETDVASNIAIAESASATTFIPVALTANTNAREKLNVMDTPSNKGKEVMLYGKIQKYFSVTGLKDLEKFVLDGSEEEVTGVGAIKADADVNAPAYNLKGQRVTEGYKGLVIKNGKKVIMK